MNRPRTTYRGRTSLAAVGRAIEAGDRTAEQIARRYRHDVGDVRPGVAELLARGVVRDVYGELEFTSIGWTWAESGFRALYRSVVEQRRMGARRRAAA